MNPPASFGREDTFHFNSSIGWMWLAHPGEALQELEQLTPEARLNPDALEIEWWIHAESKQWSAALKCAVKLAIQAPDRPSAWLNHAFSLRRAPGGSLLGALEILSRALPQFPSTALIPYNMACYLAQLGRLEEAWEALEKAKQVSSEPDTIHAMALRDEDLIPLHPRLQGGA